MKRQCVLFNRWRKESANRNPDIPLRKKRKIMAKKIIGNVKLQVKGGQANPSPPIGPALGQHGVNIPEFCKAFNARTQDQMGVVIPVIITIYADRSFSFITKTPPASVLLKQAA